MSLIVHAKNWSSYGCLNLMWTISLPPWLSVLISAISHSCWWNVDIGGDFRTNGPVLNTSKTIGRSCLTYLKYHNYLLFSKTVLIDFQLVRSHYWRPMFVDTNNLFTIKLPTHNFHSIICNSFVKPNLWFNTINCCIPVLIYTCTSL